MSKNIFSSKFEDAALNAVTGIKCNGMVQEDQNSLNNLIDC